MLDTPRLTRRTFLTAAIAALALAACRRDAGASRCAYCGMRIDARSHWNAGALDAAGHALNFDTPGCLFRYRFGPHGAGVRDPWVTEYYGAVGRRSDARSLRYAVGSDVIGPMGPDLVPLDPARADTFATDHHARTVIPYELVTLDVLRGL
jgi:hypothetical protein